jgi:alpha-L-rhamnosidase
VRDIKQRGYHLSTGFVGTPYLMHVLTRFGQLDLAYRLLLQESYPSWLYPVTQGATTIWERWDGWTREKGFQDPSMNSFNHYAYGSIGDWLYSVVAGIEIDARQPGYKHILFRPQPGGELTWVKGRLNSIYGEILSEWRITTNPVQEVNLPDQTSYRNVREKNTFEYDITVPPNTTATVYLPGSALGQMVESGKYHFSEGWTRTINYEVNNGH